MTEVTERMKDKIASGTQQVTASSLEIVTLIFEAAHSLLQRSMQGNPQVGMFMFGWSPPPLSTYMHAQGLGFRV